MSTDRILFDEVAKLKELSPRAKLLYADICMVTALFKDCCYKYGTVKGSIRLCCCRKTYHSARQQLIDAGLVEKNGRQLIPLAPFDYTESRKNKLLGEGGRITKSYYRQRAEFGSIPVSIFDGIPPAFILVRGAFLVYPNAPVSKIAKFLGMSRTTVTAYVSCLKKQEKIIDGKVFDAAVH